MPSGKPVRTPIRSIPWKRGSMVTALGIDPGFADCGLAVVGKRAADDDPVLVHVDIVTTKKAAKKAMRGLRVLADDQRRLKELHGKIMSMHALYQPSVIGVESYSPQPGRAGSSGWKVSMVYGGICWYGYTQGILVLPFLPADLKRRVAGKVSASKQAVQQALNTNVFPQLNQRLQQFPMGKREHIADAAGHALLAVEEVFALRQQMAL